MGSVYSSTNTGSAKSQQVSSQARDRIFDALLLCRSTELYVLNTARAHMLFFGAVRGCSQTVVRTYIRA